MHDSVRSGRSMRPLLVRITTGEPNKEMALAVNGPMTDSESADPAREPTSSASMDLKWNLSA